MEINKFMVASLGKSILIMRPPIGPITPEDAMTLAAWLVKIAEMDSAVKFEDVLTAIQNA